METNKSNKFLIKSKKQMFAVIAVFTLMLFVGGTTYAFFNYTRTGAQNIVRTGTINFSSSETGNTVTLNNVFPVSASTIGTANESANDVRTVEITIDGNTTYNGGIEYVLTLDDVNIESNTTPKKEIPLSLNVTVEGLDSKTIGTPSDDYFTERGTNENPSTTALYSILAKETVKQDEQILVGYIPKNVDVKGKVIVKSYIDDSKVLITDTPVGNNAETDGYTNGTDVTGKTVITTTEWNSLNSTPLSFRVRVEANEGIWVEEVRTINAMNRFPTVIIDQRANIKEVYFNKMGATRMQQAYDAATIKADLTYNNEGKVLAWLETNATDNTKYNLIVASDGDTYLNTGQFLFAGWSATQKIIFNNINSSRLTTTTRMFAGCSSLMQLDLSNLGSDDLLDMDYMFQECTNLTEIIMDNFNIGNVTRMNALFENLSNLKDVSLQNIDTSRVTQMSAMFQNCSSLTNLDLSSFDFSHLTQKSSEVTIFKNCNNLESLDISGTTTFGGDIYNLFNNLTKLKTIYVSQNFNVSNQPNYMPIFTGCTSLVGTAPNGTKYAFDSSKTDKTMAVIATDTTPGYLTDISLKPTN